MAEVDSSVSVTEVATFSNTFYWVIKGFKNLPHQQDDSVMSNGFYTYRNGDKNGERCKGVEWYLALYPRGDESGDGRSASLYVCPSFDGPSTVIQASIELGKGEGFDSLTMFKRFNNTFSTHDVHDFGYEGFIYRDTDPLMDCSELVIYCTLSHPALKCDIATVNPPLADFVHRGGDCQRELMNKNMMQLFKQRQLTDVQISIGRNKLAVHKVVLASSSAVFLKMLTEDFNESRSNVIKITDVTPKACEIMIHYMYGEAPGDMGLKEAEEVLHAAEKYELDGLKMACEKALYEALRPSNAARILVLSDRYRAERLKRLCLKYIARHKKEVTGSSTWAKVMSEHAQLLLEYTQSDS